MKDRAGNPCFVPKRPVLAEGCVRFAGEAVAAVVAVSRRAARDAAERIELELEDLPAVTELDRALDPDAAVLHEAAGSNLSLHYENGDDDGFSAALSQARHRITVQVVNNRVAPSPLEPRSCVGCFDDDGFTLYNPSQGAVAQQMVLAKAVFRVPVEQVRVISIDTGGGFGIRGEVHPEAVLCLHAARELGGR